MDTRLLGRHLPRISNWVVFDQLVQMLVFGCADHHIADATVSSATLRRRRSIHPAADVMGALLDLVLDTYDRMIGLVLDDLAIDCYITRARVAAR